MFYCFVAATVEVRSTRNQDVVAVCDLVARVLRAIHAHRAAVTGEHDREYMRLHDALPEAAHLLCARRREEIEPQCVHGVHGSTEEIRLLRGVGVEEGKDIAAGGTCSCPACPLLAEPAMG